MGDAQPHGHAGAAIRILRDIRKWSQGQLADKAGVHLNTVSRFESDPGSAQTDTLQKLAKALGHTAAAVKGDWEN